MKIVKAAMMDVMVYVIQSQENAHAKKYIMIKSVINSVLKIVLNVIQQMENV